YYPIPHDITDNDVGVFGKYIAIDIDCDCEGEVIDDNPEKLSPIVIQYLINTSLCCNVNYLETVYQIRKNMQTSICPDDILKEHPFFVRKIVVPNDCKCCS